MSDFSIIMAYMDGNNTFRRRNLFAVIDRCLELMPDVEIVVAEQGKSGISEKLSSYNPRVQRIQVDEGTRFHKTRLLNEAVKASESDVLVMVDADSYVDETVVKSIEDGIAALNAGSVGILFPFNRVDYLNEPYTRDAIAGNPVNSEFCDHGAHIQRQTGLCNMFLRSTWVYVGGYDEDFYEWGAEDDAFMSKIRRLVGPVCRSGGHIYHLFHPHVNTERYKTSSVYIKNRKMCACIRRMSMEDLVKYVAGCEKMKDLVEKYDRMHRLQVNLTWHCTPLKCISIDTTLYDIDRDGEMSFTKLLEAVMAEDGADAIPDFVHEVCDPLPDLTAEQRKEIDDFVDKARKLSESGE